MKNDFAALSEQITDVLNQFAGSAGKQARRGYADARSQADGMWSDLSDRGSAVYDAAHDAASSLEESLEDIVHDRPLATIGIALGVGFVLGAIWRR